MKAERPDISVVICAYTEARWDDLVAAVDSVRHQQAPARETIVVIDHNPALLERARAQLTDAVVVENHEARGLSGARNSGVAVAQGAVVAFLDDDAMAQPEWLARLWAGYVDERVLGVGGGIEPLWLSARPAWFPDEFNWVVGCTYRGLPVTPAPVRNLIGANMSFRREVFASVGGFSSGIGQVGTSMLRCDDTEFCIRLRQARPGQIFLYDARARVQHRVPASRANWHYFTTRCYTEGLAKSIVSQLVGAKDGLAAERTYTLHTLPSGVLRGCADTLLRWDAAGIARAGAIVVGLALTIAGYVRGISAQRLTTLRKAALPGQSS